MATLKPSGLTVYTTEFNVSSNSDTLDQSGTSIYRRRDIEELAGRLHALGHGLEPVGWSIGIGCIEGHVDVPPYRDEPHLKLKIEQYT